MATKMAGLPVDLPLFRFEVGIPFQGDAPDPRDVPEPATDFRAAVWYRDGLHWVIAAGGPFRADITKDDLLSIAGGRLYRCELRWKGDRVAGSSITMDYTTEAPPHEPAAAPASASAAKPKPAMQFDPANPTASILGNLDPQTALLFSLQMQSVQQQRSDNERIMNTTLELGKVFTQQQPSHSGEGQAKAVELLEDRVKDLKKENEELLKRAREAETALHDTRLKLLEARISAQYSGGKKPEDGNMALEVIKAVAKDLMGEFVKTGTIGGPAGGPMQMMQANGAGIPLPGVNGH